MTTQTTVKKRKRRKHKAAPKHRPPLLDRTRLGALVVLGVIVVMGIIGTVAFDDRHWQAFDDAGRVAYERGNFDYAQRMYNEALQVAQELQDPDLIRSSLLALSRVDAARRRASDRRRTAPAPR
ncbi:MAG: hypothetical protein O2782_00485 [bacterium]|nr:hypothetical protein [bacterium]